MADTKTYRFSLALLLLSLLALPFIFWDQVAVYLGIDVLEKSVVVIRRVVGISVWLLLAYVLDKLISVLLWESAFVKRYGSQSPKLLRNLVSALIYLAAFAGIAGIVFEKNLTVMFAATGGAGIVIGFAVQALIADFFAGIVLNVQRPFKVGERVTVNGESGMVVDIGWRSTVINGKRRLVIVPNSKVTSNTIINSSHEKGHIRNELIIKVDYDVPVERVKRVLLAAIRAEQEYLPPLPGAPDFSPFVVARSMDENGITYVVVYWSKNLDVDGDVIDAMIASIQHHMQIAGIRFTRSLQLNPSSTVVHEHMLVKDRKLELLRSVEIFAGIRDVDQEFLVSAMREKRFAPGDEVIRQGEDGQSMFVVAEGLLEVLVTVEGNDKPLQVAKLIPGKFLGEMSMLTGQARTATVKAVTGAVLYEITKENMAELFQRNPDVVNAVIDVVELRRLKNEGKVKDFQQLKANSSKQPEKEALLLKVQRFFGLRT